MNTNDLISVLIPAYNHEKYIQETIEAIINQKYKNLELIIIDDGSSDKTFEKILEMKEICLKRFSKVVFETQKNQGVCETLNRLFLKANGKYVFINASDDVARPNTIERLYEATSEDEYVLIVGNNEFIDSNSKPISWNKLKKTIEYGKGFNDFVSFLKYSENFSFDKESFGTYENLAKRNHIPNGYLVSKKALNDTGGYQKDAPLEDWYINLQLSKIGKFKYVDEILFSYRWHSENNMKNCNKIKDYADKTIRYEIKKNIKENRNDLVEIIKNAQKKIIYMINLPNFFEIYKYKDLEIRKTILKILNKEIILKQRKNSVKKTKREIK